MDKTHQNYKTLIEYAITAREKSYSPYSKFSVGAALLADSGKIYCGCNIESAAYGPSVCAERTAFFKAVSEGERNFKAIAIAGASHNKPINGICPPCGVCRQVMMEFCNPKIFKIILPENEDNIKIYTLEELLPLGFGADNIKQQGV